MSEQLFLRVPLESVTTAIKDGTHGTHSRVVEGVPFLSAKNITKSGLVYWDDTDDCIAESEYELIHKAFRLQPKDLLLTIVGSLGRRAIFDGSKVTFQRSVAYLRPDAGRVSERFLFHWFGHAEFQQELLRRSNSTAQAGLYLGELAQTLVPDCALSEQGQIADVLDTLDTTIRQTEAIIAKLKQVKQGLLHDLLTRGIDANGELRPPQGEAPHLYKASPLGWIPLSWNAIRMHEAIHELGQGWSPDCATEAAGSDAWGVLKTTAIGWEGYSDHENKALPLTLAPRPELEVLPHDILITRAGPKERVAVVAYVEQTRRRLMISDKMYRLRLRTSEVPSYFALALSSEYAQGAIRRTISGMADSQTNISQPIIRSLLVMRPPQDEQQEIALRVAALSTRLDTEQRYAFATSRLKSGLMDDLLTGRVRVTPLLTQSTAT